MIQAVLFDFDGVLVDSMPFHVQAWQAVFSAYDIAVKPEDVLLLEGARAVELASKIFKEHNVRLVSSDLQKFVDKKQEMFREIANIALDPPAVELVKKVGTAGLQLGLVTGTARANVEQILGSELISFFDGIITGDDVDAGKPAPACYLKAANALAVAPESCLVIENAPLGIQAARAAGMVVAAVTTTLERRFLDGAHFYAATLAELLDGFDDMVAGPGRGVLKSPVDVVVT